MKKRSLYQISLWVALIGALLSFPSIAPAQSTPQLPQVFMDTTYASPGGRVLPVASGGDFQAALNSAQPGDIIELQAGATFTGNFTLPNKSGNSWIYIRSSAYASLPPPGTRVSPTESSLMPKIITPNTSFAISTAPSAHHYRFVGIEITTTNATTNATTYNLVWLEAPNGQTSLSQVPNNIVFDRCYLHGTKTGNVRRGIALNSAYTAVIDSYLSDFHEIGVDSQALLGWNGPGPFKIVNNYLEGAGENILFGGGDPAIPNLVPSDIEVRRNRLFKPLSWRVGDPSYAGIQWSVKNIFELKNARRVLVEGNILENNWAADQSGYAVLFTVRNQDGAAPWAMVQDVTFINNIVRHTGSGVNILGWDSNHPSQQTKRILIKNNLFEDVNGSRWGGSGRLFQLVHNTADVTIDHNTAFHTENILFGTEDPNINFVYRNNITPQNQYGIAGTNTTGNPVLTLNTYTPGAVFMKNAIVGASMTYPSGTFLPVLMANVGFVDLAHGNYRLAASSPYKDSGTDGKDIGADFDAMDAAMNGSPSPQNTPPVLSISVSPGSLSFGSATVGTTGLPQNVQITNTGSGEVALSSVSIAAPFAISQNDCVSSGTWNGIMAAGTHCDISVVFTPVNGGNASGTLIVGAAGNVYPITLTATGVGPMVSVSPGSLSFGSATVGTTGLPQNVQITNTGSVEVALSSVSIAAPFAISQNDCVSSGTWNGIMAPGTHCDVSVVFTPVKGGNASGTLIIGAAGNVYPVILAATGVSADATPPTFSGVKLSSRSSSDAVISWKTNEATDSQVEYGPTTAYGMSSMLATNMVTAHSVTLSGLSANKPYHYRVKSRDAAGNLRVSGRFTFRTAR